MGPSNGQNPYNPPDAAAPPHHSQVHWERWFSQLANLAAIPAGAIGGALSWLLVAHYADWRYGGQPAYPTILGFLQMAIFGSVCGSLWGAAVCLVVYRLRTTSRQLWRRHLVAMLAGLLIGAAASPLCCVPFHLPVDLQVRE